MYILLLSLWFDKLIPSVCVVFLVVSSAVDISENILKVEHPLHDSPYPHKIWIEVKYPVHCMIFLFLYSSVKTGQSVETVL